MTLQLAAFYVFATVTIAAALAVISARNPVHSVLLLVLTFFSTACIWLLAEAEFLAIALVLVYVGAVMVLFLFVVMMLDIRIGPMREGFARYLPIGIVVGIVMVLEMLAVVGVRRVDAPFPVENPAYAAGMSNTEWIGHAMFTDYLLPFELAAVLLTVAIIAAIALTLRRRPGTKHQDASRQVQVRAADRLRIVRMPSEPRDGGAR